MIRKHFHSAAPDFFSLDVEGDEEEVLQSNDWNNFRPKIICLETLRYDANSATKKRWELIQKVESLGYVRVAETWINSIFVDEKYVKPVGDAFQNCVTHARVRRPLLS